MPDDILTGTHGNGRVGASRDGGAAVRDALMLAALWLPLHRVDAAPLSSAPLGRADIVSILGGEAGNRTLEERAWSAIDCLDEPVRDATLRDLVSSARETYALSAAHVLVYGGAVRIDALVAGRIVSFSDESRTSLLRAIVLAERGAELMMVPERLLEHIIDTPAPAGEAIDVAAVIVAADAEDADLELLRRAVHRHPRSRGLWLGLAIADGAGLAELPLALSVQTDVEVPLGVRTAAAVAVSSRIEASADFAAEQIRAFVDRFGPMSLVAVARTIGAPDADVYETFWDDLRLVGMLRYLKSDRAVDVAIDALAVENEAIRQVAAAVLAARWPMRLLDHGRGRLGESEHAALLVLLGLRHPTLRGRASASLSTAQLDETCERLSEFGEIGLLEWAGPVMAGF